MMIGALLMSPLLAGIITAFGDPENNEAFIICFVINEMFLLFLIGFLKFMSSFIGL